ncbi:hypothetical protein MtrunA17_Chr5g0433451 [Medicago truncatula]|uniref:Transmembrane protein n=1 Tax=Medicago truncatula TaxID=3880 RepID=A0A396I1T6_MEDTR|nr:hypothetical protein MtrunA17_Chr5g0433451 [Medicago truncatula]
MVKHYSDLLSVFYLSDKFVGFYYLLVVTLHLLITLVCTCVHCPPTVSCNLTPRFLHGSVFRIVSTIRRYTSTRKGYVSSLLSHRYLNQ